MVVLPWSYAGTESVSSVPSGVVDWVLLQLRSGSSASTATTVVAQRAAFLKSDGSIVDMDGTSPVSFSGVSFGNYYIVIEHRNHLAVISSSEVTLSTNTLTYDFTTGEDKAYTSGPTPMADLGGGKFGMFSGDGNSNGFVTASDNNSIWLPQFLVSAYGYNSGDYNLSGFVTASDNNQNWLVNNGKASQVP